MEKGNGGTEMNERDKELARQAGFVIQSDENWFNDMVQKFADLIRADEREACAKVCDEVAESRGDADECATEIRVRGNT